MSLLEKGGERDRACVMAGRVVYKREVGSRSGLPVGLPCCQFVSTFYQLGGECEFRV